ncbi:tetratricopeptide repeat protein [Halioxenophilus aromaticivorans]|uniref:Sel1 repeat family protein n=1 Tax=Halioxenophilus aromaticivorans TaxID=1306992 RepID=A0AAV3TYM4_9ALTE
MQRIGLALLLILITTPSTAQFAQEEVDHAGGVLNPSNFSWHYYLDQMKRFPERIGIICYNAYIVEKAGLHEEGFRFFSECAERGSSSAMIQMSLYYDTGFQQNDTHIPPNPKLSTLWLKRAAEAGHPLAKKHYGQRLMQGIGTERNVNEAKNWLQDAEIQPN